MSFQASPLERVLQEIVPAAADYHKVATQRLDALVKPPQSLGHLETIAARLMAIQQQPVISVDKRCVIVLAADNGVVAEGVSSAPQTVTALQTINILNGLAGVSVLARQFSSDLMVVDVGVASDLVHPNLIQRKIRASTGNIAREPALTRDEVIKALETGLDLVREARDQGYKVLGVGEMGIGNTTTSSAVLAGLLGLGPGQVELLVGRGAGLSDADFCHKVSVIEQALQLHQPDQNDVLDVLAKVGGLDLATMTGVYLGAAASRLPVVMDGFISVVAALCAVRLAPSVRDYLFASHQSYERGYAVAIRELNLPTPLQLDMRLGEGSGCPLLFALMDAAAAIYHNMGTFSSGGIDLAYTEEITF